ncbi:hypothetical protein [Fundidesulfovibrio putealis]|uniref:hypothetical protein n=1 Tax=Fundidesulfovibrio putealis TaxID=270496 RepID=UPI0012EC39BA|nr:hypothetical protein [Fundidesulfovibrio putealis]
MNDRQIRGFDLSAMVTKNQASVKSSFDISSEADAAFLCGVLKTNGSLIRGY